MMRSSFHRSGIALTRMQTSAASSTVTSASQSVAVPPQLRLLHSTTVASSQHTNILSQQRNLSATLHLATASSNQRLNATSSLSQQRRGFASDSKSLQTAKPNKRQSTQTQPARTDTSIEEQRQAYRESLWVKHRAEQMAKAKASAERARILAAAKQSELKFNIERQLRLAELPPDVRSALNREESSRLELKLKNLPSAQRRQSLAELNRVRSHAGALASHTALEGFVKYDVNGREIPRYLAQEEREKRDKRIEEYKEKDAKKAAQAHLAGDNEEEPNDDDAEEEAERFQRKRDEASLQSEKSKKIRKQKNAEFAQQSELTQAKFEFMRALEEQFARQQKLGILAPDAIATLSRIKPGHAILTFLAQQSRQGVRVTRQMLYKEFGPEANRSKRYFGDRDELTAMLQNLVAKKIIAPKKPEDTAALATAAATSTTSAATAESATAATSESTESTAAAASSAPAVAPKVTSAQAKKDKLLHYVIVRQDEAKLAARLEARANGKIKLAKKIRLLNAIESMRATHAQEIATRAQADKAKVAPEVTARRAVKHSAKALAKAKKVAARHARAQARAEERAVADAQNPIQALAPIKALVPMKEQQKRAALARLQRAKHLNKTPGPSPAERQWVEPFLKSWQEHYNTKTLDREALKQITAKTLSVRDQLKRDSLNPTPVHKSSPEDSAAKEARSIAKQAKRAAMTPEQKVAEKVKRSKRRKFVRARTREMALKARQERFNSRTAATESAAEQQQASL